MKDLELDTDAMQAIAHVVHTVGGEISSDARIAGGDVATAGEGNSGFNAAAALPGLGQVWSGTIESLGGKVQDTANDISAAAEIYVSTDGDHATKLAAADDPECRDLYLEGDDQQCPSPGGHPQGR